MTNPGQEFLDCVPVEEWAKEVDEQVLLYVVHNNAKYESDPAQRREKWEAWCVGYWSDIKGGGWVWHGKAGGGWEWHGIPSPGHVTHVAPLPQRPHG